jgi:hypothetical protein
MDYGKIKHGAELRVVQSNGIIKVEYKNLGAMDFSFFTSSFDHLAAEREANRISKIIHDIPKTYKTEGHVLRKREQTEEMKEWMN